MDLVCSGLIYGVGYVGLFSWGGLGAEYDRWTVVVMVGRWGVDAFGGMKGGDCVRSICSLGLDDLGVIGAG